MSKSITCRLYELLIVGVFVASVAFIGPARGGEIPESQDPIKVILHDWTGQIVVAKVSGEILVRMGYNVEYVTSPMVPAMNAMGEGDLHLNTDQWLLSLLPLYEELSGKGQLVSLGRLGLVGNETLYYPGYVEADCPGLPNWEALKNCAALFAVPETDPKGRVVDYPEEWTSEMPLRLEALDLDYVPLPAGGEGALIAEIRGAFARNEPLLINFWEPHWIFSQFDLRGVKFPEWHPDCEENPSWGLNPEKTFDCTGRTPRIEKVVWHGFEEKWPAAFRFIQSFKFTNADQAPLTLRVDVDGEPLDDVVKSWVDENKDKWQPWVDAATM